MRAPGPSRTSGWPTHRASIQRKYPHVCRGTGQAFDLTADVLAALAVGTALLAVRLGRLPASAEAAEDARAEVGQGTIDATGHLEEPAATDTGR
ncbi:hypothetical protein [Streptomyces caelestis]|uniref:hypothetical protein n=1 Tax=Streptomyces caelestis TaxID=36816 RepID=UPI0036FE0C67